VDFQSGRIRVVVAVADLVGDGQVVANSLGLLEVGGECWRRARPGRVRALENTRIGLMSVVLVLPGCRDGPTMTASDSPGFMTSVRSLNRSWPPERNGHRAARRS